MLISQKQFSLKNETVYACINMHNCIYVASTIWYCMVNKFIELYSHREVIDTLTVK